MALGYALTVEQILAYYGGARPEVPRMLARAAAGRRVGLTDSPEKIDHLDLHLESTGAAAIGEAVGAFLGRTGLQPGDVPVRYPALHATVEWDIVLETDIKHDSRACFREGRKVIDFLESYGAPYRVKFSGNASAHVIIPSAAFWNLLPEEGREHAAGRLRQWVIESCGADVDTSFNQNSHFLRLPYALNERTGLVSLPLRPEQLDTFEMERAEVGSVVVEEWWFDTADLEARREGMQKLIEASVHPEEAPVR